MWTDFSKKKNLHSFLNSLPLSHNFCVRLIPEPQVKYSLPFTIPLFAVTSNVINNIKHQFTVLKEKLEKK